LDEIWVQTVVDFGWLLSRIVVRVEEAWKIQRHHQTIKVSKSDHPVWLFCSCTV